MRVLLVEDSRTLADTLALALTQAGIVAEVVADGLHADALLGEEDYDAVVLDLELPRMSGLRVLERARRRGSDVPVLILTASGDIAERIRGLDAGADDYLPKPFDFGELLARLRAIARRRAGRAQAVFCVGRLCYDSVTRLFALDREAVHFTPRERRVLEVLVTFAGRPVSKAALLGRLAGSDDEDAPSADAIEVYVHRLRKRLAGSGTRIRTLRGLGYVMEAGDEPAAA